MATVPIVDEEFKSLTSTLSPMEYAAFEQHIRNDQGRQLIKVWNNVVVDGHKRLEICQRNNSPYALVNYRFEYREDAKFFIIENRLIESRSQPISKRAVLVLELRDIFESLLLEKQWRRLVDYSRSNISFLPIGECVYFLVSRQYECVKIGYATDVVRRVNQIRCSSPSALDVAFCISGGIWIESLLHQKFDKFRSHREWYHITSELCQFIAEFGGAL